jgi:CheY-like chemotaxis protein
MIRNMPSRNGPTIPAIALTAYAREEDRIRAESAGFHTHLCKPVDSIELTETIRRLVGPSPSASPSSDLAALAD